MQKDFEEEQEKNRKKEEEVIGIFRNEICQTVKF